MAVDPSLMRKPERDKLARMRCATAAIELGLAGLGRQGLQRFTPSSATELRALSQRAHNAGLIRLERELVALKTTVCRYLDKDPAFTLARYQGIVSKIWILVKATEAKLHGEVRLAEMLPIAGEARRRYTLLERPIEVQPLGANGWASDSGFIGISVHLFCRTTSTMMSAANARPSEWFGDDPAMLLNTPMSDSLGLTIYDFCHGAFTLYNAKLSIDGRLSLHAGLGVAPAPEQGQEVYGDVALENFSEVIDRLAERALAPLNNSGPLLGYVQVSRLQPVKVDHTQNIASMEVGDTSGATAVVRVSLRPENNRLIDNLNRLPELRPLGIFAEFWVGGGQLRMRPISATFDRPVRLDMRGTREAHLVHLSVEVIAGALTSS